MWVVHGVQANKQLGLKTLSQPSFSRIRTKFFFDYVIKGRGDSFARCSICDNLKQLQASFAPGLEDYGRI